MRLCGRIHQLSRPTTAFSASQCTASQRSVCSAQQLWMSEVITSSVHHWIKNAGLNFHVFQVRKAAQQGVCAILRGSDFLFTDNAPAHHPAAVSTAKFCTKEMERAGGETICLRLVTYPAFQLYGKPKPVFHCLPQAAKRTPPHFMCWASWRSWWQRFPWELSNHVAKLCYEWWHWATWWEHKHSQMVPNPPEFFVFCFFFNLAALLLLPSWWQPAPCRPFTGCSVPSRTHWPSRRNSTRRSSR